MKLGWRAASADRRVASLRYRVETPIAGLKALGHDAELCSGDDLDGYDVVVFQKCYSSADRALANRIRKRGGRVVFDLCDNLFYNPYDVLRYREIREEVVEMIALADTLICGSAALADVVVSECPHAPRPFVVGDPAEKLALPQRVANRADPSRRLLWFGSHGSPNAPAGMTDLLKIASVLAEAAKTEPIELVVCSNDRDKYERLIAPLPFKTSYVDWRLETFPAVLATAEAVVIPISLNPFTACKTHNRLTTALYAGVPVIADAIESYREFAPFCTLDDWAGGVSALLKTPARERERAADAADYIDLHWSALAVARLWAQSLGLETAMERPDVAAGAALPQPVPAPRQAVLSYQGALDLQAADAITGWIRTPSDPGRRFSVQLEADGVVIARAQADDARDDLRRAGLPRPDCGFRLVLPPGGPPANAVLTVRTETGDWSFDEPPFRLEVNHRGHRVLRFFHRNRRRKASAGRWADATPLEATQTAGDIQSALADELDRLSATLAEVRETVSRLIVATADNPALGRRALAALKRQARASQDLTSELSPGDDPRQARLN